MSNHTLTAKAIGHLKKDEILRKLIDEIGIIELGVPNPENSFKSLVEIIVGQQLSVKAAKSITERIHGKFGENYDALDFINSDLNELRQIGISSQKGSYILNLAECVNENQIKFESLKELQNEEVIDYLTVIKGIGVWSAKMFLISVMKRTNIFPLEDHTFKNQLIKLYNLDENNYKKEITRLNHFWNPYQTFAAKYMWKSKDKKVVVGKTQ